MLLLIILEHPGHSGEGVDRGVRDAPESVSGIIRNGVRHAPESVSGMPRNNHTLADMESRNEVEPDHVAEALQYRVQEDARIEG